MNAQEKSNRRNFLSKILTVWVSVLSLPALYVIVQYIIPPKLKEKILEVLNVGKISDVPLNSAKIVKFNKTPIVLVHTAQDQIKAYSAICTHLGCVVQFDDQARNFHCNCHGSVFDLDGKNIGGPAPRPLVPFRVELKDTNILVYKS